MTVGRDRQFDLAVAASAVLVYLGAVWNGFALDDGPMIRFNPLAQDPSGMWRAFTQPWWAGAFGGQYYRPLPVATLALDAWVDGAAWFPVVNLLWHAGASVAVAVLARRWSGALAGLIAGLLFAVHPVHVEAVANVVGRGELMAALFTLLAVYGAVVRESVAWSTAALVLALLSKENAAVAPALIALAWVLGLSRPPKRRLLAFASALGAVAIGYFAVRWAVLHRYTGFADIAPVFVGAAALPVRLTAVAALADVARLLVFPLRLRVDYSLQERTLIATASDPRFLVGVLCVAVWAALLVLAWRRRRRVEVYGLAWIALAFLPVANLLFPVGILIGERTLYLPSAGLALAAGTWLAGWQTRLRGLLVGLVVVAGAARTALRVPVWHDDTAVTLSILEDSPRSYRGPQYAAALLQASRNPARALEYYRTALAIYDRDSRLFIGAADAAFALRRPALADSLLERARQLCGRCDVNYANQANAARARGDGAVADSLLRRATPLGKQ